MSSFIEDLSNKYYKLANYFLSLKSKTKVLAVDFKKGWTQIIFDQKKYFIISFLFESLSQIFYTLLPAIIAWVIQSKAHSYLWPLMLGWFFANIADFFSSYYSLILSTQTVNSIQFNAFKFFITVDPIYHARRESGKIFAKVERAARSYEDVLNMIILDIIPMLVALVTAICSLMFIDVSLGLYALLLLIVIAFLSVVLNILYAKAFEKRLISADDEVKTINVESLTQVLLIRSCYASKDIIEKSKNASHNLISNESTAWITFNFMTAVTKFLYLISVGLVSSHLLNSSISATIGVSLILTYIRGTYETIKIGRRIRVLLRSITRILDLFDFIDQFGTQSFPVLTSTSNHYDQISRARADNVLDIELKNLYFNYNPKVKIFENHNLTLSIPKDQSNKLYGIIGPSGIGKTTLLSILGGQLKPTQGQVLINNIEVYDLDDLERRHIVSLQGQIASSLKGTLRNSLLLGLPAETIYSDEQLASILKEVGIWHIFEEKEGLETQIGEGGLNISGGQRQRLNFASLYLRSKYYRPLLILIDEPTSSLDEISEKAITKMINQLAHDAVTLVIAHRLKTIENATAIMDFSLIPQEKDIKFYDKEELSNKSVYFNKLVKGQIMTEDQ